MEDAKPWFQEVMETSFATAPPQRIFTRRPRTIADAGDIPGVSPKGLRSWQSMVLFHMNRGGKSIPPEQRENLQRAIQLLSARIKKRKERINGYDPVTLLARNLGKKAALL